MTVRVLLIVSFLFLAQAAGDIGDIGVGNDLNQAKRFRFYPGQLVFVFQGYWRGYLGFYNNVNPNNLDTVFVELILSTTNMMELGLAEVSIDDIKPAPPGNNNKDFTKEYVENLYKQYDLI